MGTTTVEDFDDIDAIWISGNPKGNVTVKGDSSDTIVCEIAGGLAYSEDDQPVDGDRGVPALGGGSEASEIGGTFEHFVGDRVNRPASSPVRPRIQSGSWSAESEFDTEATHTSRLPTVDSSDFTFEIELDVAGPKVSHDSMMEALEKDQNDLYHELSSGVLQFRNTTVVDSGSREREASGDAVAAVGETFEASGDPPIEFHPGDTIESLGD